MRAQPVFEIKFQIVIHLVKRVIAPVKRNSGTVRQIQSQSRSSLLNGDGRPQKVVNVTERMTCGGRNIAVIGGTEAQSTSQIASSRGLGGKSKGIALSADRSWSNHAIFIACGTL